MPHSNFLPTNPQQLTPCGFGEAVVSSTALSISHELFGFSAAELLAADRATISVQGTNAHIRWDGGDPSATAGFHLDTAGGAAHFVINGNANVNNIKVIRETGSDADISIQLEKIARR